MNNAYVQSRTELRSMMSQKEIKKKKILYPLKGLKQGCEKPTRIINTSTENQSSCHQTKNNFNVSSYSICK